MKDGLFEDIPEDATITAIRPLESDPNVRSVRVGRRAVARLRAADIEELGLAVGTVWSEQLARAVDDARLADVARRAALRFLGRRAYSIRDLTERLERSNHRGDLVSRVVGELVDGGWLDDEAYARTLARQIVERQPAAATLIEHRLLERGLDESLTRRIAEETLSGVDPVDRAMEMAQRQRRTLKGKPPLTVARRIGQALARRGFDDEAVRNVLDRLGVLDAAEAEAEAAAAAEAADAAAQDPCDD